MILSFSGTGNSRFVADCLADHLNDQVVSLNEILRAGEVAPVFESEKPFLVCFPIYAWGMPPVLRALLGGAQFRGSDQIYFVATMGANSGKTDEYCKSLSDSLGLKFCGFSGVVMPDNYVVAYPVKTPEQAAPIIAAGAKKCAELAQRIASGESIFRGDTTALAGLKSGIVNRMFSKYMGDTKNYVVSDACTKCGTCVKVCPLANIALEDGKVSFGSNCTACYACIHRCPSAAIDIKGKTEKNGRYVCPDYAIWKEQNQ